MTDTTTPADPTPPDAEAPLQAAAPAADQAEYDYPDEPEPAEQNGFEALGLSPEIVRAVVEKGYTQPTPIQAQAIPYVLMGRDILGTAQTGTGKTAGFTLPMLDILSGSRARARMPRSLILEPTRELALQVAENFVEYGKYLKLTHALVIGGESMADQKEILMRGVDVLIATPGRLMDMFERGSILLSDVKVLVIDEADRMLDMGFIPDVEKIVGLLPKSRQTLFFSATMAPEIKRLADAFLQNPKLVAVDRAASVATTITEALLLVADADKREALRRLIASEDVQNALIFCNRKKDVDILYKSLGKHGFSVGALHGDMAQPARFATLEKFKAGELRLLCCSDVAARGIDIGGLSHVFNFDVPHHSEDYVHRIGRTGRAGREGRAFSLATPEDRQNVEAIEKLIGHPIPRIDIPGLDAAEWAESDGRRGRGRSRAAPRRDAAKPAPIKDSLAKDSVAKDSPTKAGPAKDRPARERAPRKVPIVAAPPPETDAIAPEAIAPEAIFAEAFAPEAFVPDAFTPAEALPIPAAEPAKRRERDRDRPRRDDRARDDRAREDRPREADRPRRDDRPRDEPRRDEPRREDPRREDPRREDRPREDRPRDDRREEFRRRDRDRDDLGPRVAGFGDETPAFMMVAARPNRADDDAPTPTEDLES